MATADRRLRVGKTRFAQERWVATIDKDEFAQHHVLSMAPGISRRLVVVMSSL